MMNENTEKRQTKKSKLQIDQRLLKLLHISAFVLCVCVSVSAYPECPSSFSFLCQVIVFTTMAAVGRYHQIILRIKHYCNELVKLCLYSILNTQYSILNTQFSILCLVVNNTRATVHHSTQVLIRGHCRFWNFRVMFLGRTRVALAFNGCNNTHPDLISTVHIYI